MMIEYRRVTRADREAVYRFAVDGMRPHLFPMVLSPEKVRAVIDYFIDSHADFHMAAFDGDEIVGAVAAGVAPMLWFERCEASIVVFRATKVGVGAHLLASTMKWAKSDNRVKRVLLPMEFDAPRSMARYLRRHGFLSPQGFVVAYT